MMEKAYDTPYILVFVDKIKLSLFVKKVLIIPWARVQYWIYLFSLELYLSQGQPREKKLYSLLFF